MEPACDHKREVDSREFRFGDEERRLMHLVPAPAVRLKKRRVLSRPGVNSLLALCETSGRLNKSLNEISHWSNLL